MKNRGGVRIALLAARAVLIILAAVLGVAFLAGRGGSQTAPSDPVDTKTARPGYYRDPAIHGDTIIFTAEGDQPRVGIPTWNMQYAFRGHIVVLCDRLTASDGEAFSEGFRRLGLGKIIGVRTWGGEIWLSASNWLADRGIATAAETGVYGPEGKWLFEGQGVDPGIVVDNLPYAAFLGSDAQPDAAPKLLQEEIRNDPWPVPKPSPYPNKAFKYGD